MGNLTSRASLPTLHIAMAKAMKAMKVMKKMAAMKAMKAMKKKSVRALPKSGIADALAEVATSEVSKGQFKIPGLVTLKKKTKPARAAGTRLMFGKTVKVKAQKAKTIVKAYCVKALKDSM